MLIRKQSDPRFHFELRTEEGGRRTLSFVVPVPEAKKNRGHIRMVKRSSGYGLRPIIAPNKAAVAFENRLRLELDAFLRGRLGALQTQKDGALWPSDDVSVAMTYDHNSEVIYVTVSSLRPRPKGKTGRRRDLHNILEAVLDGIQSKETRTGLKLGAVKNDNQVAHITQERLA